LILSTGKRCIVASGESNCNIKGINLFASLVGDRKAMAQQSKRNGKHVMVQWETGINSIYVQQDNHSVLAIADHMTVMEMEDKRVK